MAELVSAAAAAASREMTMLLMVDTKFVPLLPHLPCIVVAVEEYLSNALSRQIKSLSVVVFVCLFEKNSFMIIEKKSMRSRKKRKKKKKKKKRLTNMLLHNPLIISKRSFTTMVIIREIPIESLT